MSPSVNILNTTTPIVPLKRYFLRVEQKLPDYADETVQTMDISCESRNGIYHARTE